MARDKSSKSKDKKKQIPSQTNDNRALKRLIENQEGSAVLVNKSLKSLKKIKKQLKDIVLQRDQEQDQLKQLNKKTRALSDDLAVTEAHLSKRALKKDLKKLKARLDKKSEQFQNSQDKLNRQMTLFDALANRVEQKIQALENEPQTSTQQFDELSQNHEQLFEKLHHFEQELYDLNEQLSHPQQSISDFSEQLDQIQKMLAQVNLTAQEQDTRINLLQTDTENIRMSLQQVQNIQQARSETIDDKLSLFDASQQKLISQNKELEDSIEKKLSSLKDDQSQLTAPLQTHLKVLEDSLNFLGENLSRNQSLYAEDEEKLNSLQEQVNEFGEQLNLSSDELKRHIDQLIAPLQEHLKTLEDKLSSLDQNQSQQQQNLAEDHEQLGLLMTRANQFDEQLKASTEQLKNHIQELRSSDLDNYSQQFEQISLQLTQFTQQYSELTEQSSELQSRINEIQTQHQSANEHHDELSRQYLTQQQKLDSMDSQLHQLSELDNRLESSLSGLSQKIDKSHSISKNSIDKLQNQQQEQAKLQQDSEKRQQQLQQSHHQEQISQLLDQKVIQDEQSANLAQLRERIKTRSQLFAIGLIGVLALSTMLLLNQDVFQQSSDKDTLVAEIKTQVTNETYRKINALTKQNSTILNNELKQIRSSIEQVRSEIPKTETQTNDIEALKITFHDQHQHLQNELSNSQTEQQDLKQSVVQMSETLESLRNQVQALKAPARLNQTSPKAGVSGRVNISDVANVSSISAPFYAIQLVGAMQVESINHFMQQNRLSNKATVYQTERQGHPWYILIYGHYTNFSQARNDLLQLSQELKNHKPWIKKLP